MSFDETRLFEIIPVESFILKTAHFDLENHVNPAGTLVIETTAVNVANLGLPDYFVDISLLGMALVELDPDKATIRKMHSDVLTAVQSWTPELVSGAFGFVPPARCVGIINITSLLSCDATRNMFRLDCRLVLSDVVFTTDYGGLGTAFLVDEKWNNNHTKKTTYICYSNQRYRPITRVITEIIGNNKLIEITYGFGAWEDRENLAYYRN